MSIHSLDTLKTRRNWQLAYQRLRWLEDRLFWRGQVKRSELVDRFGISEAQASKDIAEYQSLSDQNLRYDTAVRRFYPNEDFKPLFPKSAMDWLKQEQTAERPEHIPVAEVIHPARRFAPEIVRQIIAASESKQALRITYQSMSSPTRKTRLVCPHHIVETYARLHLRAWDDESKQFRDFLISRIESAEIDPRVPWVDAAADREWHHNVDVVITSHPALSSSQRKTVEREYGMRQGRLHCEVRQALLLYFLDQLGLVEAVRKTKGVPEVSKSIACANAKEIEVYLPSAPELTGFRRKII